MRKIPFVATAGRQPAEADLQAFGSPAYVHGAAQPRHAVAAPPGAACPLPALAAAEIAADRV
jgi:hypothetical protein